MMKLPPQSSEVISKLLDGQTAVKGSVTLGPLDRPTRSLLSVMVRHFDELGRARGDERASSLRDLFVAEIECADATPSPGTKAAAAPFAECPSTPNWKIEYLRCVSIRGIASPGEEFHFELHGKSNLVYGPNGSGKSSLLGAIIWILTGEPIVDTSSTERQAPLYRPSSGTREGSKLCDWPVVATLPTEADVTKVVPGCWAEILLSRPTDGYSIHLRRRYGSPLEASTDGTGWTPIDDLEQIGVSPLDVQLSITAPTIFGRRSIEEADHTRNILGLMLGFDELQQLGELASEISSNRTRLANKEEREIAAKVRSLAESLRLLSAQLPDGTDSANAVKSLAAKAELTVSDIDGAVKRLAEATTGAEDRLAKVLCLPVDKANFGGTLADRLTVAVDSLAKGIAANFPALLAVSADTVLPARDGKTSAVLLDELNGDLEKFFNDARAAITARYDWWTNEVAPGSKLALLRKAAEHFEVGSGECPVCERPIDDPALRQRLTELKMADTRLASELRTFFADLSGDLRRAVPQTVARLSSQSVGDRLKADWSRLKQSLLGEAFSALGASFDSAVETLAADIAFDDPTTVELFPNECDPRFLAAAQSFANEALAGRRAVALLYWAKGRLESMLQALDKLVTNATSEQSLFSQLAKGKQAAEVVKPLVAVSGELRRAKGEQVQIDSARARLKTLEELKEPLDSLKPLAKYAEAAVRLEFDSIKDTTAENLKHMYPEHPTGMTAGKLRLGKGKDKSVESLLSRTSFDAPGRYFANAGLQRAVALAFYFALLGKHPKGLGFVIMDDPILSLDEEHRERWSANILRPTLRNLQVVLATHQRQFLRHRAHDFEADRVVELNPRDNAQRISWKPGDRLQRAADQLAAGDHLVAATTMRKFREDVLSSLSAYSPAPFFDRNALAQSATNYEHLQPPHPLSGKAQVTISRVLKCPEVGCVLDPGSHSLTEADVTKAMAEVCHKVLLDLTKTLAAEFARLGRLREQFLAANSIEASIVPFPRLDTKVTWAGPIELSLIGAAAAKSGPWTVELHQESGRLVFAAGGAVQVCGDSIAPIAYPAHWALLAQEGETINDEDLVAAQDENGTTYLRRVWSNGREWTLQSVNPVRPHSVSVPKRTTGMRKIIGVLYTPVGKASPTAGRIAEWLKCSSLDAEREIKACGTIDVCGDSFDPIARNGQKVLVDEPLADLARCTPGELAVLDIKGPKLGCVIKRVFPRDDEWVLISPNPVDRIAPIVVSRKDIRTAWIIRGVLFETAERSLPP